MHGTTLRRYHNLDFESVPYSWIVRTRYQRIEHSADFATR